MFTFLATLIVISSLLLVLVVLAQNSKGGGLSSQFGGSGTAQIMGVKRTGDILEKLTWGLAIAILVFSLSTKFFIGNPAEEGFTSPTLERAQEQPVMPTFDAPLPTDTEQVPAESKELENLTGEDLE